MMSLLSFIFLVIPSQAAGLPTPLASLPISSVETSENRDWAQKLKEHWGVTYFSFFYGPGVHPENFSFNPNHLGNPGNDGINFSNQVSIRYKFSQQLALDFQNRFNVILNNDTQNPNFQAFRWESPRIGVSGKLWAHEAWTLTGAVNTDFPYFFPAPFTGYQAQQRKVIFNPGMFAALRYEPRNSRWSLFSVVSPRYFFFTDRNAAEPQMQKSGLIPQNKPELIIAFLPTVNYALSSSVKLTFGTSFDYRKMVVSDWNPFHASLISNGDSQAWRLNPTPMNLGVTYSIHSSLVIFPFISTYPIAAQRIDASTGQQATFLESASIGMWLSGTLF
jgi:hypothetical protein